MNEGTVVVGVFVVAVGIVAISLGLAGTALWRGREGRGLPSGLVACLPIAATLLALLSWGYRTGWALVSALLAIAAASLFAIAVRSSPGARNRMIRWSWWASLALLLSYGGCVAAGRLV